MSQVKIRAALETALSGMAALATAYENVAFVPVANIPYQRVNMMWATPDNREAGAAFMEQGYMQVTLMYPLQSGPAAAAARAELLRTTFKKGNSFTNSGVVTQVTKTPIIGNGVVDGDRWSVPVKIPFKADIN